MFSISSNFRSFANTSEKKKLFLGQTELDIGIS